MLIIVSFIPVKKHSAKLVFGAILFDFVLLPIIFLTVINILN
jgi:hypothetical protein